MIPELGHYAIILAFCLAIGQAILPLVGVARNNRALMQLSRSAAFGQCFFVGLAFAALAYSFLTNDFSVAYVAENSNTHLPWVYRFCAVWGAHEGSLLLWVFILTLWMSAVSIFSRQLPLDMLARVLAVLAIIAAGFYLFLLTTSDPFVRLLPNFPVDGRDLNPILQDPGLVIHPPMLYMGYVGFSVAFAFAIAALLRGKFDAAWARWTRPWTMVAWCFLTFGIVLGSWWAYRELGWGGFWFWDPVENASLLPWLVGTALIHVLVVAEKRDVFKAWTILLAVCAFSLSLLGTFLVRSGVLISVHAFAVDPKRGLFLLEFLMIVVGASLALYAWRSNKIVNTGQFNFWSRETLLLSNNLILFIAMVTVLLGTLYPLIIGVLHLGKLSVGAPYFNAVFVPLMIPMLLLMGIAPRLQWHRSSVAIRPFVYLFAVVLLVSILIPIILGVKERLIVVSGVCLALWVIANSFLGVRASRFSLRQWGMLLAHVGVGVTVIGLLFATTYSQSRNISMKVGDQVSVGDYQFKLTAVNALKGPNYSGAKASVRIQKKDGRLLTVLHPEQRFYPVQETMVAKTAIQANVFRDLYVALGASLGHGAWAVRIYYKPFVRWIWWGGFFMIFGGIFALFAMRRHRYKECLDVSR